MENSYQVISKWTILMSVLMLLNAETIVWLNEPQSQYVRPTAMSPLLLDCQTNASTSLTQVAMWKRNGTWFYNFQNKHYTSFSNGSLYFSTFLQGDQGVYQCTIWLYSNAKLTKQIDSQEANIQIASIADTFTVQPQSYNVTFGQSISLQCVSPRSLPSVNILWEKDGELIYGYPNVTKWLANQLALAYSIQLNNLSISSSGDYRCMATNPLAPGKVVYSHEANIQFTALMKRPYFVTKPIPTVGKRFRNEILSCNILGEPKPRIYWYHNNILITSNSSSLYIDSIGDLHFNPVQLNHNGTYYCKGVNSIGNVASFPPVPLFVAFTDFDFKLNPRSTISYSGNSAIFDCQPPRSYPMHLKVLWYHKYRLIRRTTKIHILSNNSLVISAVTPEDIGIYFCSVTNPLTQLARTSRKASLDILVLPTIGTSLVNITAKIGETINITCKANGRPNPVIVWYKANTPFNSSEVLFIGNASISDSGWYSCAARNTAGEARKKIFIHVFVDPSISTKPINQTATKGETARFKCVTIGKPSPSVSWGMSDKSHPSIITKVEIDDVKYKQDGFELLITNLTVNDRGWYHCLASSIAGLSSTKAYLEVYYPPLILHQNLPIYVNVSGTATMKCESDGNPTPSILWYQIRGSSEVKIHNTSKFVIKSSSLMVLDSGKDDSGIYVCNATNTVGSDSTQFNLIVQAPPSSPLINIFSRNLVNTSFSIFCHASGNPQPNLTLFGNGAVLHPIEFYKHNSTLHFYIEKLRFSDSGLYSCEAENILGNVKNSVIVVIQGHPDPPYELQGHSLTPTVVNLTWSVGFNGNSRLHDPIIYFKPIDDGSSWSLHSKPSLVSEEFAIIEGLMPCTEYIFRVYTENDQGRSQLYDKTTVKTLSKDLPTLHNISASALNASMVQLNWPKPKITCHDIISYNITFNFITSTTTQSIQYDADSVCHKKCYVYIDSLMPFKTYQFFVQAAVYDGKRLTWTNQLKPIVTTTRSSVPSFAPGITNIKAVSSNVISLKLIEIPLDHHNGVLQGYRILYKRVIDSAYSNITTKTNLATIHGLLPFSAYTILACGYNSAGNGVYSDAVTIQTLESVPGPVQDLSAAYDKEAGNIVINWNPPLQKNGILKGYILSFWNSKNVLHVQNQTISSPNTLVFIIHNATSSTDYSISAAGFNSRGSGSIAGPIYVSTVSKPSPNTDSPITPKPSSSLAVSFSSILLTSSPVQPTSTTLISDSRLSWFNKDNFPLILGVLGAVFLIFTLIIICLIVKLCRKKKKAHHWIVKKTEKAVDDISHLQTSFIDVRSPGCSDTVSPQSTDRSSQDKNHIHNGSNDPMWDALESPTDNYARLENNTNNHLMKLRSTIPPELGKYNEIYDYPSDVTKSAKRTLNSGSVTSNDGQGSSSSEIPSPPPRVPMTIYNDYEAPPLPIVAVRNNNCEADTDNNSDSEESGIIIWA